MVLHHNCSSQQTNEDVNDVIVLQDVRTDQPNACASTTTTDANYERLFDNTNSACAVAPLSQFDHVSLETNQNDDVTVDAGYTAVEMVTNSNIGISMTTGLPSNIKSDVAIESEGGYATPFDNRNLDEIPVGTSNSSAQEYTEPFYSSVDIKRNECTKKDGHSSNASASITRDNPVDSQSTAESSVEASKDETSRVQPSSTSSTDAKCDEVRVDFRLPDPNVHYAVVDNTKKTKYKNNLV